MQRSEQINELATALAKAQGEMEGASKEKENPHFRSRYADLGAVYDAVREPLAKHGLSVTQWMRSTGGDGGHAVEVETFLMHASGQWMSDAFAVPVSKVDAQGYGSACTYARRYALMAAVGIAPVDDDANAAVGGSLPTKQQSRPAVKASPKADPPGDPFAFAKAAIAGVAFGKIPAWVDRCVVAEFGADQKDALLELLATRAMQTAGDDTPPEAIESIIQKITAARKGMTHTFA